MKYTYTTQRQLRAAFWEHCRFLSRHKVTDFSGKGKMYNTDTRCAFVDWIDFLRHNCDISEALASSATLD